MVSTSPQTTKVFASGDWLVSDGQQDEFQRRWTDFLAWSKTRPGFLRAILIQSKTDPSHYVSISDWENDDARVKWGAQPEFTQKYEACKALCASHTSSGYTLAVQIDP